MKELLEVLASKKVILPDNVIDLVKHSKSLTVFNTVEALAEAAVGGPDSNSFEVKYNVPGKGDYTEAIVHRVRNGVSANYTDAYMRRRDPDTMAIADNLASDKVRFNEKYGYSFDKLQNETFDWLKENDLAMF
ncbi:MAG TPA: DUF4914 family protein, partial [Prolixibacteraceae bacterium]|nr:DUF4914 family protein [Prolixibacteraceae bacterium]